MIIVNVTYCRNVIMTLFLKNGGKRVRRTYSLVLVIGLFVVPYQAQAKMPKNYCKSKCAYSYKTKDNREICTAACEYGHVISTMKRRWPRMRDCKWIFKYKEDWPECRTGLKHWLKFYGR